MSELIRNITSVQHLSQLARQAESEGKQLVYVGDRSVRVVQRNALERAANALSHQDRREAAALDAFASELRQQHSQNSGRTLASRPARLQALVGKTLAADVASRFVAANQGQPQLSFDGTGRLLAVPDDGAGLSELELTRLEESVVADLGRANAPGERDAARTESECVLQMMGALRQALASDSPGPGRPLAESDLTLKRLWLSGQMNQASAQFALQQVAEGLAATHPDLAAQAQGLAAEAGRAKSLSQRHDNTFGRMFESALARELVAQPAPSMLQAAEAVQAFLLKHLQTDQKRYTAAENVDLLAKALAKDPRPWHAEVPGLQAFLAQPTLATLGTLLSLPVQDGYQMMMVYWIAAKVSSDVSGPWMSAANHNYQKLVKANRSTEDNVLSAKGAIHAAQAGLDARSILDELDLQLRAITARSLAGDPERAKASKLISDLLSLSTALSHATGTHKRDDGSYRMDRQELAQAIAAHADLLQDPYPAQAEALRALLPALADAPAGQPETVLEIGTQGDAHDAPGWKAEPVKAAHYGTGLPHQPRPHVPENWQPEMNIPARGGLSLSTPRTFERQALENNQNTVNGISGTTNMLVFMLDHMAQAGALRTPDGQELQPGDALAGNLAFLVMDGGHSIPEAMATAASIAADPRTVPAEDFSSYPEGERKPRREKVQQEVQARRQAVLDSHITDYSRLGEALGGGLTGARVSAAVTDALEATRERFDQLHAERLRAGPAVP